MSAAVEVVMPATDDRRSLAKALPTTVRVVSSPSERTNVYRIFVAHLRTLKEVGAVDLISRIRSDWKMVPVVFVSEKKRTAEDTALFQHFAIASRPNEPALVASDDDTVARIVRAHQAGAEKVLIATARIEQDQLWVWSCEPKLYRCPVSALPLLRGLSPSRLPRFEISKSGSRLHWPDGDIDLTLDAFQAVALPSARASQERQYRRDAKSYAQAIRTLRKKHGLSQSAIEGLSDRAVRRIEQGERIPHASTLEKLAKAHGLTVDRYMGQLATLSAERKAERTHRGGQ
jgi:hypothetical protein